MKKIALFIGILLFIGCTPQNENKLSPSEYQALLEQTVLPIPDSALTAEQMEIKIKLLDICHTHICIEGNGQKLSVGKDLFEKEGLPAIYYNVLQYQIEESNEAIKKWMAEDEVFHDHFSRLNQDSLMKESKEYYWNTERPRLMKLLEAK